MRRDRCFKTMATLSLATMAALIVSCSDGPEKPFNDVEFKKTPLYEVSMNENQTRAAESFAKNAAAKAYGLLEKNYGSENVCYSPLSLQMALSMFTHNCGESVSKEISDKYLEFFGVSSLKELEDFNGMLLKELPKVDGMVKFTLANSVWENEGKDFIKEGASWLSSYSAEKFKADFNATNTVKRINDWTLKKTNDRISIYNEDADISIYDILYINALHFIGKWSTPFEENVAQMNFTDIDGNTSKAAFLCSTKYTGGKDYESEKKSLTGNLNGRLFAKIPFGNGGYNMYAVLPTEGESVADCANFIEREGLRLEEKIDVSHGDITIPAFEASCNMEKLGKIMEELGFPMNFTASSDKTATIDLKQKTFFKVTKDGAEGAGVTSTAVSWGVPQETLKVVFNRPFIYYVMEESTGTVLFIGSVKRL